MSLQTVLQDLFGKKRLDENKQSTAPELQQGQTYLNDRSRMCKGLRSRVKIMEGFTDMTGDSKNVVAGLTHSTDSSNKVFEQPVLDRNKLELQQLEEMQKSFQATMGEWAKRYKSVSDFVARQPKQYQSCLDQCRKTNKNEDELSACLYGCNVGRFANYSYKNRGGLKPTSLTLGNVVAGLASAALTATGVGAVLAAGVGAAGAIGSEALSQGGTQQGAPYSAGQGKTGKDIGGSMGTYGPQGRAGVGKDNVRQMINTQLSSDPQWHYNFVSGETLKENDKTTDQMKATNPAGMRAIQAKTADAFLKILKGLENEPLVKQMADTAVDATKLNEAMSQMTTTWKALFAKACKAGIGGFGTVSDVDTKDFGGHTQYCDSWVNTKEGRSGWYSKDSDKGPFIADNQGNKSYDFVENTIKLNNVGKLGCDAVIPADRADSSSVGGAGYCVCADGRKVGYSDRGHPGFTCNQLCSPENKKLASQGPLYHNSQNWVPAISTAYGKTDPEAMGLGNSTFLKCGGHTSSVSTAPPPCGSAMKDMGPYTGTTCGTWDKKAEGGFFSFDWLTGDSKTTKVPLLGRQCAYVAPPGYEKPMVNNYKGYKALPTQTKLLDACQSAPYENLYTDILQLKVLEQVLEAKSRIIYQAIKESYGASNSAALKGTAAGKSIAKNMTLYRGAYKRLQSNKNREAQLAGMLEDVRLKRNSVNISYYIWFILAISGMFFVIRNIRKGNQ